MKAQRLKRRIATDVPNRFLIASNCADHFLCVCTAKTRQLSSSSSFLYLMRDIDAKCNEITRSSSKSSQDGQSRFPFPIDDDRLFFPYAKRTWSLIAFTFFQVSEGKCHQRPFSQSAKKLSRQGPLKTSEDPSRPLADLHRHLDPLRTFVDPSGLLKTLEDLSEPLRTFQDP